MAAIGKNTPEQALVPAQESGFLTLTDPTTQQIIKENVGDSLTAFMLPRLRIPAGGNTAWQVPTESGEVAIAQEITGVITYKTTWRAYWKIKYGLPGSGGAPDCSSKDGIIGEGDPGGECVKCPLNKFGTDNRGKACKELRPLFVLREGDIFPTLVVAPPSSIAEVTNYGVSLANKRIPYYGVVSGLKLVQATNQDNMKYSKLAPRAIRTLTPEEAAVIGEYRIGVKAMADAQVIMQDDYATTETSQDLAYE